MADKVIHAVGLDAGSTRTRCVIVELIDGHIRYRGHGDAPARGWSKGRIVDQGAVMESILSSVRQAELAAQLEIDSAVVGVGGSSVRGANTRGILELGHPRELDQRDVNRVIDRASRVMLQE